MGRGASDKALIAFNSGEFSPLLDSRADLEKTGSACRVLENFLIEPYGAVRRRPGSQYIATTKHSGTRKSTEWRFQFSTETTYMLEVGHEYIRFFANGVPVLLSGSPYEIATPFQEEDLFQIQFLQIKDVIYITHQDYPQHKISRLGHTNWIIEEIEWTNAAFLDENLTEITLSPTDGGTPGEIDLLASDDLFTAAHVGAYFRVGHNRAAQSISTPVSSNLSTTSIEILGKYFFRSYGIWSADILIQRSLDGSVTWETLYRFKGASDRNIDGEGEAAENGRYRIKIENYVSNTDGRFVLEATDAVIYGVVKLTAFVDAQEMTGEEIIPFYAETASAIWAEGAWSHARGYPRAVALHEQRVVYGGTRLQPQTFWGSAIDDYENFLRGVADDNSYVFTLDGKELNAIQWMVSASALLIGTTGGEWRAISRSAEKGITPSAIDVKQQSSFGSEYVQAVEVNETVLFVQRKGKILNELVADEYRESAFKVANLTLLAEHIAKAGIVQMARQIDPISTVWCVMADGTLAAMTYDRTQNVVGWHRHPMDGFVESVCTIYGEQDADDEVWITVRRVVQAVSRRFIERLNPRQWVDQEDAFFVDAGATYEGAPADTISGIDWLEGRFVNILADGKVIEGQAVVDGTITLDVPASIVQVGLGYTSTLVPFRLDSDQQIGYTGGKIRKITKLKLRLLRSLGLTYNDGQRTYELPFRKSGQPLDALNPLFTGDKEVDFGTSFEYDNRITISQSQPLPLCIMGILPDYIVTGT
jgi:hypothetical protein